jgi:hypothetical protein
VTALGSKWHVACLRCAHCNVQLELGKAKCDEKRRIAFCTLDCAVAATTPAPPKGAVRSAQSVPVLQSAVKVSVAAGAATDTALRQSPFERVAHLGAADAALLQQRIKEAAKTSPPKPTSAKLSPPLSPSSPSDDMDDEDVALLQWRVAEAKRVDLERELAVVVERVDSRRAVKAHVGAGDDDDNDVQKIATLRRDIDIASKEVERRAGRHARAKHKHSHQRSSGHKKRTPRSRSPSPPPPVTASPASQPAAAPKPASESIAARVASARAGDTSTMVERRDMLKGALQDRRADLAGGDETWSFK